MRRTWSRSEDARLVFDEARPIATLARLLGRTARAIERRRARLGLTRRRGASSLAALAERAGVHPRIIVRIAGELGQRWPEQRRSGSKRYRIQEEDAHALLDELVRRWNQTDAANGNRRPNNNEPQGASPP